MGRRLTLASFLDDKRGLGGATIFIMAILVIIIIIVATAIFIVQTKGKERIIKSVSGESADDFLLSFLASEYEVDGFKVSGEELIFLTSEGLDSKYLKNIVVSSMEKVCNDGCYGEFSTAGLTFTVGDEKFPKKISSSIDLPIKTEVTFYVKK